MYYVGMKFDPNIPLKLYRKYMKVVKIKKIYFSELALSII